MTPKHLVQVKEERVDTLHFDSQAFIDLWKIVIEKSKKFIFIIDKQAKNSKLQKEQKWQTRRKKERKKERQRKKRRRNGDASSRSDNISLWLRSFNNDYKYQKKKKNSDLKLNL